MSTTYVNTINSNPIFADRATKDASGNDIQSTYAHDSALSSYALSADVSAYRVVSATATQLYAGTSFLTSVNGAPVSASRAGNAANASMANSAYYDGTGRLISALPDNATVSSIASGYVTGVSATVANNSASWGGGGGSVVSPSGTIFVSGSNIEGTNSAVVVAQTSTGVTSILPKDPSMNAIGPNGMSALTYGNPSESGMTLVFMLDHEYHGADATVVISGRDNYWNFASASGLIVEGDTSANIPLGQVTAQLSASSNYWVNLAYGYDFSAVKAPGYAVTGVGELAWNSALTGVSSTVANHSAAWEQGGVSPSTVSSIASSYASSAVSGVESAVSANSATWNNTGVSESTVSSIASSYANSAASSKQDSSAMSAYALSSDVSGVIDTVSSNSATWGQGGVDSATVSAIASSYAESAASSKLDSTAQVVSSTAGDGTYITAINGMGISGQGGVDSATVSSIASSYAQDVSAAVSGTVDTVSSQSANWGGSALALSAGPGVKLEKVGDTLVASTDETVLWSGTTTNITGITLNETYGNFDRVRFYWKPWSDDVAWRVTEIPSFALIFTLDAGWASNGGTGKALFAYSISSNGTEFSQIQGGYQNITGSNTWASSTNCSVAKVVGVNRTAGV